MQSRWSFVPILRKHPRKVRLSISKSSVGVSLLYYLNFDLCVIVSKRNLCEYCIKGMHG